MTLLIKWAKGMSSFINNICANDRLSLLEGAWAELFLLFAFESSTLFEETSKFIPPRLLQALNALQNNFKRLEMDQSEIVCLRGVLLYRPELPGIENSALVQQLQDQSIACNNNQCAVHPQLPVLDAFFYFCLL
uniref:NR LBD domain-containing protein n=1 Tax=Meloidogyne incognita TaxID=6306 RepID=A0A914L4W1_MELIC